MLRLRLTAVLSALVILTHLAYAADESPRVLTAHGTVDKIEKDTLTIKHRTAEGKTEKSVSMTLKLTGTSRFSTLSTQRRGDKIVLVQKDTEVKNVAEKQSVAVIYAQNAGEHVLLAAVLHGE